ncbi:MAG: hypothetical protein K2L82_12550 [Lachnospiraceae bacterium]|nr:hypothetical protein [Lachnospiraceae bacterium]
MAIGFVEMQGQITRAQDFTTIKHNEDAKGMVEQANAGQQMTKQVERQVNRVNKGNQPEYHERKFDAKDKGSNEYHGDGGQARKKKKGENPDGKVLMKKAEKIDFSV